MGSRPAINLHAPALRHSLLENRKWVKCLLAKFACFLC